TGVVTRTVRWTIRRKGIAAVVAAAFVVLCSLAAVSVVRILHERDRTRAERDNTRLILDETFDILEDFLRTADAEFRTTANPQLLRCRREVFWRAENSFLHLPDRAVDMGYEGRAGEALGWLADSNLMEGQRQRAEDLANHSMEYLERACARDPSSPQNASRL